ncbi:hypothetical protein LC55x_4011 [Lysobacter capsici]|nr:hypothetical protein LC55x_4011 [Lysobacter capsici]
MILSDGAGPGAGRRAFSVPAACTRRRLRRRVRHARCARMKPACRVRRGFGVHLASSTPIGPGLR